MRENGNREEDTVAAALRGAFGEPLVRRAGELFGLWLLLYAFFAFTGARPAGARNLLGLSFLVLTVVAYKSGLKRLRSELERRFWRDLTTAFTCWLFVVALALVGSLLARPAAVDLLAELLLATAYVFFLLAVEERPDRSSRWRPVAVERALAWPAVVVFVVGYYVYFGLIPRFSGSGEPVTPLFVFLDLYFGGKLVYAARTAATAKWRTIYRVLVVIPFATLPGHLIEMLQGLGKVSWQLGSWFDLLAALPMLLAILAARLRHQPFAAGNRPEEPLLLAFAGPSGKTMVAALTYPLTHFLCSASGLFSAADRSAREFAVGWWLLLLGALALAQHRRLEKEEILMWRERKQAEHALDRSEKDLRLMIEREMTEEALQASEDAFTKASSSSPEALWIAEVLDRATDAVRLVDAEGRIRYVNPSAERLYGWSREEIVGREAEEVAAGDRGRFAEVKRRVAAAGYWSGRLEERRRDGRRILTRSRWSGVRADEDGEGASILVWSAPAENRQG